MERTGNSRRKTGILLAAVMVFAAAPGISVYAEGGPEEPIAPEETVLEQEAGKVSEYRLVPKGECSEYGYQDMVWVDEYGNEVEGESSYEAADQGVPYSGAVSFPSSYKIADEVVLPPVRNQGKWGTCGPHAALSSVETNMIKKGLADQNVDYAERHLSYFSHRRNETTGDGSDSYHEEYGWYGGTNYRTITSVLANWYGAADEAAYPYNGQGDMEELLEADRSSSICHLTDADFLQKPEDIKAAVMEKGAVMCSFYADTKNKSENHYIAEERSINHAVGIVGWSDDYGAENFDDNGQHPVNNGAWLCRNSWGENWANGGYFWISYEDATLRDFCSFQGEGPDNYDHIYQYDGATANTRIGYTKAANIFTAQAAEDLRAVSFYAYQNYDYIIEVYVEAEKEMQDPSDGILVHTQEGSLEYPGYHTVPLEKDITLAPGMKYAVSVEVLSKDEESASIYIENKNDSSSGPGQSFYYWNGEWKDTKESGHYNVSIKAFTDDTEAIDRSRLGLLLEDTGALQESDYTPSTWEGLRRARERALEIYESLEEPSQRDIIKAELALEHAMKMLLPSTVSIANEEEFESFARSVLEGNTYEEQRVYLLNDLNMSGIVHTAIGNLENPFQGTFDGSGHVIASLERIEAPVYIGLFGCIGEKGSVQNVELIQAALTLTAAYSGSIAGYNKGLVSGCSVEGNIFFTYEDEFSTLGGVAGLNTGTIEQSSVNGTITFPDQLLIDNYAGGIAGISSGRIEKCAMRGELASDGAISIGGIAGYSGEDSIVDRCYNLAAVSGNPSENTRSAGIGVCLYGETSNCYNYGEIGRAPGNESGALYGYLSKTGKISNCYYLDTSCTKGGYSPASSEGKMTEDEFASGKTAYYLNSSGETGENSCEWSQKENLPVWSDSENRPVIKVTVEQGKDNGFQASLNGIVNGAFYGPGGTEAQMQIVDEDKLQGYELSAGIRGLSPSDKGENLYVLPEGDVKVSVICKKTSIKYDIVYHLDRGTGKEHDTYDVEQKVTLPVPKREKAQFLGWYENEECQGASVKQIPKGSTGDREYWAKWEHLGYEVKFPQKKGYEILTIGNCENGKIPEDGSYMFTIKAQKGYDIENITVKSGERILVPSDGVYQIDHIMSDIDDISIEGIREIKAVRLSLSCTSKNIAPGKKAALALTVFPSDAKEPKVTWEVSNTKYASVNGKGVVTLKKAGAGKKVTVTAKAADGSGLKASIQLKIMKNAVTKVQIKNAPKKLKVKKSVTLRAVVKTNGKNANKKLKWSTSNKKYAVVNAKGKVTAKKGGKGKTVKITAAATDGSGKKASVKIKIR